MTTTNNPYSLDLFLGSCQKKTLKSTKSVKVGSPYGLVANVQDCNIVASEFKLRSCYYVHFQTKTFGKDINPFLPPTVG